MKSGSKGGKTWHAVNGVHATMWMSSPIPRFAGFLPILSPDRRKTIKESFSGH